MSGRFGKYDVVELIGQGGFGQVFRGRDPLLKRDVAIKTVSLVAPMAKERFLREAEIAAALRHPSIVSIYDFGEQEGVPYLVQEFLPGEDLSQKIQRREPIDIRVRVEWLVAIAEALRFAHQNGVVHRDVKPSNVRIVQDGSVRLVDFGIAKVLDSEQQLTGTNQSVGTSGYLSPEQLDGRDIDHRVDIFSFGVLAYELITHQKPFAAETVQATLYRILTADPTPVAALAPDVPPRLAALVERCLRKSRDERYPDFGSLIEDLRSSLGPAGQPPARPDPAPLAATGPAPSSEGALPAASMATPPAVAGSTLPIRAGAPVPAREHGRESRLALRKLGLVGAGIVGLAAVVWGGASALGVLQRRDGGDPPPIVVDPASPMSSEQGAAAAAQDPTTGGPAVSRPPAGTAAVAAGRPGSGDPAARAEPPAAGAARAGGGTEADPAANRTPVETSERQPPMDPARVLVLIRGDRADAVGTAQTTVLADLLARGRPFVDPDVVDAIRADAAAMRALEGGSSPAAAVGREYGAGTVVVADLATDAAETVPGIVTGTAVMTARYYDAVSGRLLLSERYQIGAGGTPGKAGGTVTDAITQAAEAVARQMSRAILQKTGGG